MLILWSTTNIFCLSCCKGKMTLFAKELITKIETLIPKIRARKATFARKLFHYSRNNSEAYQRMIRSK